MKFSYTKNIGEWLLVDLWFFHHIVLRDSTAPTP